MAFRWRADDGPTLNAGLVALWYFRGSGPVLLRNPIFLWFSRGAEVGPPVPLWICACSLPLIPPMPRHEKTWLCSVRKPKTQTSLCIRLAPVLFVRYSNLLQAKIQYSSTLYTFKHVQIGFRLTCTYLHSLKTSFCSKCHFYNIYACNNVLDCNFLRCTCLKNFCVSKAFCLLIQNTNPLTFGDDLIWAVVLQTLS